jgi:peroxiredoxin
MKYLRMLSTVVLITILAATSTFGQPRSKAPNFRLRSLDGKFVQLDSLRGKVVAVNFWATWCGPCRAEIAGFLDVYKENKSKGLEIVGISLDEEGWEVVRPFAERFKITYPVVMGTGRVVTDYGDIRAIPTTFIIDKEGNIAKRHVGYLPKPLFEKIIKELL